MFVTFGSKYSLSELWVTDVRKAYSPIYRNALYLSREGLQHVFSHGSSNGTRANQEGTLLKIVAKSMLGYLCSYYRFSSWMMSLSLGWIRSWIRKLNYCMVSDQKIVSCFSSKLPTKCGACFRLSMCYFTRFCYQFSFSDSRKKWFNSVY